MTETLIAQKSRISIEDDLSDIAAFERYACEAIAQHDLVRVKTMIKRIKTVATAMLEEYDDVLSGPNEEPEISMGSLFHVDKK